MRRMWKLVVLGVLALVSIGCGTIRAVSAVKDGRIALEASEQEVLNAAGKPDLILARQRVETFYYKRNDSLAVSVSIFQGRVIAFDDSDKWPLDAAKASNEADEPVATGKVRTGMTEQQLLAVLDKPDGVTAKNGQEAFHWLTGDDVDSIVTLRDGKVDGYWDRPVSEYTQNLPTADRDNATTSGKIRVGMAFADVEKILGAADSKAGAKGVTTYRYESDPVFGDTIIYSVNFKDDVVVDIYEFNVTRDEDKKEEQEAQRLAAEAEKRGEAAESSIFSFLDNPLVKTALNVAGAVVAQQIGTRNVSAHKSTVNTLNELTINGTKYKGGPALGQPCNTEGKNCPAGYTCLVYVANSGQCVQ
jgi:hypothetical protein